MPALVWDKIGERTFEKGVSKGVIYFEDGRAVVWNGLTAVSEATNKEVTPVYYDGIKVNDIVSVGDFSGSISALTYPDEMLEIEGYARPGSGIYFGEQPGTAFNLSYQTLIGNDVVGCDCGYKIHILYNVTAVPSDRNYETVSNNSDLNPFEWTITTVPEEVPGFRPTSRIIIDSRYVQPELLEQIELMLYGFNTANPSFPSFEDLMGLLTNNYIIDITDLKDGRWTATTNFEGYISRPGPGEFQIDEVDAVYIDPDTYEISDTIA